MRSIIFLATAALLATPAHAAKPKSGCTTKGKPVLLATVGGEVDTVLVAGDAAYAVRTDTVGVWDREGYSFPGPTYSLVPLEGGAVIELQAPKFEGYRQGAWSARSWLGVGALVVAVGPHPSGTGIVVARWRLPDAVPAVLQFDTGKLSRSSRPVGPVAAAAGETLAIVWTESKERFLSPTATQPVVQNEARVMATVVDLKTDSVAKPVEVVEGEWGTAAFGNVVPSADGTGFVVLQSVYKTDAPATEGSNPLSWRLLSRQGVLDEVKGKLPWEAWLPAVHCGGKVVAQAIESTAKGTKFSVRAADLLSGTVSTTATAALGVLACQDGTPVSAWGAPTTKRGQSAVRFAPVSGKAITGTLVTMVEDFNLARVAVASSKTGPVIVWSVKAKSSPTVPRPDRADVYAQQMTCGN